MYEQRYMSYVGTRAVYDLSDGDISPVTDCVVVCLPVTGWRIARSFLEAYGKREVQFASEYNPAHYRNLSEGDWDTIQDIIANTLGACEMSCTDLVEAIDGVALAVSQNSCGVSGSNGAGGTDAPADTFVDTGGNQPDGFPTRPDYLDWKCKRANIIVSGLQSDIAFIDETDITGLVAPILVGALLTPIPFDDIATIVGLVGLWFLEGTLDGYLLEITTFLDANEGPLVCSLYEAVTSEDARDDFLSLVGSLSFPSQTLLAFFVSFTNTNSLFEESAVYGALPNTVQYDCANCATAQCWCNVHTDIGVAQGGGVWDSEDAGFAYGVNLAVNSNGMDICLDTCGAEGVMNIVSLTGHTTTAATSDFQINDYPVSCSTPAQAYASDTQWADGTTGRLFQIWSSTPFTVSFGC